MTVLGASLIFPVVSHWLWHADGWLKELGNPYLISLFDGNGMLGLDLGVYGAPETFLIDANGVVRYRHVGDVNPTNWASTLEPMYNDLLEEAK